MQVKEAISAFGLVGKPVCIHTSLRSFACRVRDLVDVCVQAFQADPLVAHFGDGNCERCNDAAKGGPVW